MPDIHAENAEAPLLDAYIAALDGPSMPFTVPGHKRRAGRLDARLGRATDNDVPLFAGLDTMKLTAHRLETAERRAATLWGADWCRFGTCGSSQANHAVMLGLGSPGDVVVVARGVHRSVVDGLVLSGLRPVWLPGRYDEATRLPAGPTADQLSVVLAQHPDGVAVWLSEPGYLGTVSDVGALTAVAHEHGMPVVVDQAWGAHLGFHPAYPPHALAAGADAMVVSAHKALPSVSQAALILARAERLDLHRLQTGFDLTNTTSPAGAILASIDGARMLLEHDGPALLGALADRIASARRRLLEASPDLRVPGPADLTDVGFDPAKLVIQLSGAGLDGVLIGAALAAQGVTLEMAERDVLVASTSIADDAAAFDRLVSAVIEAVRASVAGPTREVAVPSWYDVPEVVHTPREATFAPSRAVPAQAAVGEVAAELVTLYPPGVPVLVPGERVTGGILAELAAAKAAGARVAYAADPTLQTIRIVAGEVVGERR